MRSMTGFGRGEKAASAYKITVEIKTVNHRYLDLNIRLPQALSALEDKIRRFIAGRLLRGRTEISVFFTETEQAERQINIDKNMAMAYYRTLRDLSDFLALPPPSDVYPIAAQPGVISVEHAAYNLDVVWADMEAALQEAVEELIAMRSEEGKNIASDLARRVEALRALIEQAESRAPFVVTEYQRRFRERIQALLAGSAELDEARLVQETAIFADKTNFTEETVRLRSHLNQFQQAMTIKDGAVGRKLDFIVQEMNRETNTIASKANDFTVTNLTVEAKSEIEKIREQIQNIE